MPIPKVDNEAVQILGPAYVYLVWAAGGSTAQYIGMTRNGVDITEEIFMQNVPADYYGGDDGPPIDAVHLGRITHVRLELTKWAPDPVNAIRNRLGAQTQPGIIGKPGTLLMNPHSGGGNAYELTVQNEPHTVAGANTLAQRYPIAILRSAVEHNRATKFSIVTCTFECHADSNGLIVDDTPVVA